MNAIWTKTGSTENVFGQLFRNINVEKHVYKVTICDRELTNAIMNIFCKFFLTKTLVWFMF